MFGKIKRDGDRQQIQDDLNKMTEWPEKWQMLLNFCKCKCLHTGHWNEDVQIYSGWYCTKYYHKRKRLIFTKNSN